MKNSISKPGMNRVNRGTSKNTNIQNLKVVSSITAANNHISSVLSGKDGTTFRSFTWKNSIFF